jgi:hypothetical protein
MSKVYPSRGGPVRYNKFGAKVPAMMPGGYSGARTGFKPAPKGESIPANGETFADILARVQARGLPR